ncbi:MAG: polymerase, sigma-24 subunit, subfamily [Armatimonadetes bacterium]|jgi:RNA polymerase sigma-70 factor (ECF subfamily)|nr:polymerase, sigma-24 subunit, subfamily [Armatimonadota bacterium]
MTYDEYEEEVLRLYPHTYQVCWRIVRDRDQAADLTQEATMRALLAWEKYDPSRGIKGVKPWVATITRNVCLDAIRRIVRVPEPRLVGDPETELDRPDEEDEYEGLVNLISVFDRLTPLIPCLERLTEIQRTVLWLWATDHSWSEISRETGRSIRTCRSTFESAVAKVRRCLDQGDSPEDDI